MSIRKSALTSAPACSFVLSCHIRQVMCGLSGGRRGEERRGGGWSHGWSVLLVVAAGGDANSDNQRGKEGGKSRSRLGAKNGEGLSSPCNLRRTFQRPYQAMVLHNFFLHRNVVDRLPNDIIIMRDSKFEM